MTMPTSITPKVILFDIGGVCVSSPFRIILDYEVAHNIPSGWINYSISKSGPEGAWSLLERNLISLPVFHTQFTKDLHNPHLWTSFHATRGTTHVGPLPSIDGKYLFTHMFASLGQPDPWMYPALRALRKSNKYIIGALSNTVIFPPGHVLHAREGLFGEELRGNFDVFVSSAHVGLRKPDARIYRLALERLDAFARENADTERGRGLRWEYGVTARDVLFLDDIGENLKAAKLQGFATVKVQLGRAYEAVEELERVTGLRLAGKHPKIPERSKVQMARL